MTRYIILCAIGLGIDFIVYGTNYFITSVPDSIQCISSIVSAAFLIAAIYFYRREKNDFKQMFISFKEG